MIINDIVIRFDMLIHHSETIVIVKSTIKN